MTPITSPPDPQSFNASVWDVVRRVPVGRVATYGQIARLLPLPGGVRPEEYLALGARWVGTAMAKCPADVPWQRVINSKGEISPRPGAEEQRRLLEAEGVAFSDRGRVDLARYGWDPDEPASQPPLFSESG